MPQITDLVITKNDGVTPVTFSVENGAPGDGLPAKWKSWSHTAPYQGLKPQLRMTSRDNGPKTARRIHIDGDFFVVQTDTTTGVSSAMAKIPLSFTTAIPLMVAQADIDEAVSQFCSAVVALKASIKAGSAPI